jgi:TolB protein
MRLVYAGVDGALYAWTRGEEAASQITWAWDEIDVRGARTRLTYTWPTCSPDGTRILALARRGTDRHLLHVVHASGVEIDEIAALDEAPIYANWSPDGTRVAVLLQRTDTLSLEVIELAGGRKRSVVRGAPLFWSWSPDGTTLAVHAGPSREDLSSGGVSLIDVASGELRAVLSSVPALFRAPSWSADGRLLAFARLGESGTRLVLVDPASGERRARELARGPVAFVWHPRLPLLAYATATDEAPHVYERVSLLDVREEREDRLTLPTLAFFWHPQRAQLFRLGIDRAREELSWERIDGSGDRMALARFLPTREIVFAASFFDQYALSHAPVAPDGSCLAVAGRLTEDIGEGGPRIYVIATDAAGAAETVGDGLYPVWGGQP